MFDYHLRYVAIITTYLTKKQLNSLIAEIPLEGRLSDCSQVPGATENSRPLHASGVRARLRHLRRPQRSQPDRLHSGADDSQGRRETHQ